jgi:hypothetical protein
MVAPAVAAVPFVVPALIRGAGAAARLARAGSTRLQTAVVGGIAVGGVLALNDAASLYNSRVNMASQYQEQHEFPNDLTGITPFYMSFLFQTYEKRAIKNSAFLRSRGTIRLPIPDSLKDSTAVTYNEKSLSLTTGAALEAVAGREEGATIAGSRILSGIGSAITGAIQGGSVEIATNVAKEFGAGGTIDIARAYTGVTTNPYQTILFEKPNFKSHSFTWKLVPTDYNESITIRNIIRTFQYHMLPGVSDSVGLFFSFPSMVTVSLFPSSQFLYRFKPCVIDNVTVNYSPGATPSFYRGTNGAPTAVTITVSLKEIEYFTNKDYVGNSFDDAVAEGNQTTRSANERVNNTSRFPDTNSPG